MEDNVRSALTYCACVLNRLVFYGQEDKKNLIEALIDILSYDSLNLQPPPQVSSISAGLRLILLPQPRRIPDVINLKALAAVLTLSLPLPCCLFYAFYLFENKCSAREVTKQQTRPEKPVSFLIYLPATTAENSGSIADL